MKKLLSTFALALLATISTWAQTTFTVDNLKYKVTDETTNTVELTGYETEPTGTLDIPATVNYNSTSYSMTSIGNYAFYYCSALTQITIPNSVESIGNSVFSNCSALKQVNIGDGVTSIGDGAFLSCSALAQVTIGDGVESIGNSAFYECSALKQITLPESVTSIGDAAFAGCSKLTQVNIPDGVTSIGNSAFSGCSALKQITLPERVTSIGEAAFSGCNALTQITIPNSVESIGNSVFSNCSALKQVTIGDGVTSIGERAFSRCSALAEMTIPNSVTSIGNSVFSYCSALKQVNIGDSVTSIGESTFQFCSALTQVTIGDGVESIGNSAFYECSALTQVTIPGSVTSIGNWAFSGCSALAEMTVLPTVPPTITASTFRNINLQVKVSVPEGSRDAYMADENWKQLLGLSAGQASGTCGDNLTWTFTTADSTLTISGTGDMYNYSIFVMDQPWLNLYQGIKNISLQDGVTSIGGGAFAGCRTLTQVTIGDGVTSIGNYAFQGSALTQVNIPNSVESIGDYAFSFCYTLTQVNIPDGVTSIGDGAFYLCTALTQVTIGNSVANIGDLAFYECYTLTEMTVLATVPPTITASTFRNINPQVKVSIPEGSRDAYMADENWKWLLDLSAGQLSGTCGDNLTWTFTTADSTLTISGTGDMYDYGYSDQPWYNFRQGIKNIFIPDGVTSIGDYAFCECSALTQVTIPGSVASIGNSAFHGCSALTQVTWNAINCADFTSSNYSPFDSRSNITTFTFGSQVEHIPAFLCYGMDKLTQVNIPDGVTSIGGGAFLRCSALTQVTLPESVTSIGNRTFQECLALTQINIPDGVTSIGDYAFCECSALAQVTIPNSVTSIGYAAFANCSALKQVTIGDGVTSIGNYAFYECSALTQVTWNAINCVDLSYDYNTYPPFFDCPVTDFTFGDQVKHIPAYLCYGMDKLTQVTIGNSVTSIGNYAFYECSALAEMTVLATVPPTIGGASTFYNVSRDIPVYVPAEALEDYWVASVWKEFNLHAMPTALQTPSMPESIRVYGGMLHNPQGLPVSIYDMQGRMVYSGTATTVSQPAGVYVVLCAGASRKVLF